MAQRVVKVGLVGMGTVGSGVAKLLLEQASAIEAKTGVRLELARVVDKDLEGAAKRVKLPAGILSDDINTILKKMCCE